jgi:CzcA family heavy metal efflux pump
MRGLISAALRLRFIVVALALLLMGVGGAMLQNIPLDVFPEFAPPRVEIQTEVPGLSAPEVEALVTVPIENALNGVARLDTLRSRSVLGLSSVLLIFEPGVDLLQVRPLVQERLATVSRRLPEVAEEPVILSPLSSTSRMLKIGMQSDTLTQVEVSTLALWTVRPRLMAIPGVANVAVWGQRDRQLQVQVDPERLRAHGLSLESVIASTAGAVTPKGGGFVEGANQRFNVTHVPAIRTAEDLSQLVVEAPGRLPLTLAQIADVTEGTAPPIGDGIINDKPGILLIVEKQPQGNTLEITRNIESVLQSLKPALAGVSVDPTIFRPATYIENAVHNLNIALLIGCVLVVLVLSVFLYDWRTALISIIAIPLSLLAAVLALDYRGDALNTMVLAGLIVALGEVVDDAIIDVENIMRRLRLNAAAGFPRSSFSVVVDASLEVRSAVVYGSLIVVLVLVPVFLLEGLSGAFFRPLALAYVTAIMASLAVALTVTPALSYLLLPQVAARRQVDAPLLRWLKSGYRPLLTRLLHAPRAALVALAVTFGAGALVYPQLGQEMLPNFREYDFLMHWLERPGTSLDAMNRITIRASKELRSVDGVRNFGAHVGRAEVADEVVGVDFTELWISLDPRVPYEPTVAKLQEVVDGYPGLYRDLLTYLRERIKEVLTGASGAIVVRIYGPDLTTLSAKANEVAAALASVEGVGDLHVQQQVLVPQIEIKFKPEAAANLGLTPQHIRRVTEVLLTGVKVGEVYEDQKIFDVVVRGEPRFARDLDAVRDLVIDTPSGGAVPIRDVADVYVAGAPNLIAREAASRRIDVTMNPTGGRPLDQVARDVEAALAKVSFDRGYYPELLGEFAELKAARERLLLTGAIVLLAIFLILQTLFHSARIGLLMFLGLPVALVGGLFGAWFGSGVLSLGSFIGFITVLGIAARNGIMLVSHYHHLEREEGMGFGPELVLRGAEERLAPILMTSLAAGLALLPLIMGGLKPGHEVEHPMAVVIVGGLVTSTLLNLLLIPALYLRYARPRRQVEAAPAFA